MIRSYLKAALRNIWMHRGFSFINIAGLSIGLASSFIIMLYSLNELSYDRYNKNLGNIYLATTEETSFQWTAAATPFLLGPALKDECPEVRQAARWMRSPCPIKYKDKSFDRNYCVSADLSIFQILTLPLKSGSLEGLATRSDFAVISNQMAQKIFGGRNPIGEIITVNWVGQFYTLKVAAVMRDIPETSTFKAEVIMPLYIGEKWFSTFFRDSTGNLLESWKVQVFPTYVLLSHPTSPAERENMMASFSNRHVDSSQRIRFNLFPLSEIYLYSPNFSTIRFPSGDISDVYVYSTIAILVLLIACINFVILSSGRASVRTKEIAVRKVIGASKLDIAKQIMIESVAISVLSLPVALLLVELFLPSLSQLLGKRLPETYFQSADYLLLFSGITLLAGILSGSYVSFYLSGFRPMDILRSKVSTGASKATLRKIMIAVQMVIFIGLITASLTIYKQVRYFHGKDMGFDKEDLLVFSNESLRQPGGNSDTFKAELESNPSIISVSGAHHLPGREGGTVRRIPDKSDPSRMIMFEELSVDRDFIETMKMQMVHGKSFAQARPEESKNTVIVNESAIKAFGFTDLSKKTIEKCRILGVVRDFNMRSLREPISPVVIRLDTTGMGEVAVRVRHDADVQETVSFIVAKSKTFNNGRPMSFQFFDDRLDGLYGNDYRFARMIGYFTALAIFIACLGLLGVSLFVIQTRVKEIGIRKVMGASVGTVFYLVAKEFIMLIVVSTIIAIPITMYFIEGWLQKFAYRVSVGVFVVLLTLLAASVIVLVTIGYQAIRAATANPVEALRYE